MHKLQLKFKKYKLAIILILFYEFGPLLLQIYYGNPSSAYVSITHPSNILQFLILTLGIIFILSSLNLLKFIIRNEPLSALFLIYIVYLITVLWSKYRLYTLAMVFEALILMFLFVYAFKNNTKNRLLNYLRVYLILRILLLVFLNEDILIFSSKLSHPGTCLSAGAAIMILVDKKDKKLISLFDFLFFAYIAILFNSVTIYASFIFSLFAYWGYKKKEFNLLTYLVITVILYILVVIVFNPDLLLKYDEILKGYFQKSENALINLSGRAIGWSILVNNFGHNILGNGFAATERLFTHITGSWRNIVGWSSTHNSFLAAWLAFGTLGIFFLLRFYYISLRALYNFQSQVINPKYWGMQYSLSASLFWLIFLVSLFDRGPGQIYGDWTPIIISSLLLLNK